MLIEVRPACRCLRWAAVVVALALTACSQSNVSTAMTVAEETIPPAITLLVPRETTTIPGEAATITTVPQRPGPQHSYPIDIFVMSSYQEEHHDYPAADMFATCGSKVVAPVTGTVAEVSRVDTFDEAVDDPATRGGLFVSMIGIDNVRYYMAHLQEVDAGIDVGVALVAGQPIGKVGDTGKSSACHLHFSLSPVCSAPEWWVRRGVVWPAPYLDAWLVGGDISPAQEVRQWSAANPEACDDSASMPWPST